MKPASVPSAGRGLGPSHDEAQGVASDRPDLPGASDGGLFPSGDEGETQSARDDVRVMRAGGGAGCRARRYRWPDARLEGDRRWVPSLLSYDSTLRLPEWHPQVHGGRFHFPAHLLSRCARGRACRTCGFYRDAAATDDRTVSEMRIRPVRECQRDLPGVWDADQTFGPGE